MIETKHIPAMSSTITLDYLREIGRQWTGQGTAVELGSWLGATAHALLEGLVESGYNSPFYCFDRWTANEAQVEKARKKGIEIKDEQDLLPLFLNNVNPIYNNIKTYQGSISDKINKYPGDPIEICLFDAPKREPIFSEAIQALSPYWIPGVTILGLLDYYFYKSKPSGHLRKRFQAPVRFMESHSDCFTVIKEWEGESPVFFKYVKKLQ